MQRKVSIGQLPNGMKVYVQYDSSQSTRIWGIGIKAGSIHDPAGKSGMAHLAEHVMCAESKKMSNFQADLLFEKLTDGPEGNIMICTDKTCTFFGPYNSMYYERHAKLLFEILADMMKDRMITEESLAAEKAAVNNEHYLRGEDVIETLPYDLIHQTLYDTNPARRAVDGSMEEVRLITLTDVKKFVEQYYVPKNMFLVFLGPSFQQAMEIAKQHFGDWHPRHGKTYSPLNPASYDVFSALEDTPLLETAKIFEITSGKRCHEQIVAGASQYHVTLGFPTETYLSPDGEALDVLARLLAFRIKRRLRDENRDFSKGTYRALGFTERTFAHGIIYFTFATLDAEFAKYGERVMLAEFNKVKADLVSPEELDAFVSSLYYQYLDAFKSFPAGLSEMILKAATNGDDSLDYMLNRGTRLKALTRSKLREVANKYFTNNYARAIIKPAS